MAAKISRLQKFWVKLTQWEYWSFDTLYFPVKIYFTWLAIKNRSFFFFTSSNPTIDFGGMLGESKSKIFKLIPEEYYPKTKLIPAGDLDAAQEFVKQLGYPVIAKPDIGERGKLVEKINDAEELLTYVSKCPVDFLIQEMVDYPVELGVFYVRNPNEVSGKVTSIVQKKFLSVTGDGNLTVRELLKGNPRARLQLDFNHARFAHLMGMVPESGEEVRVESIGNHCRGTTFLDANSEIDEGLNQAIDRLSKQIDGFYFGRYDLRCASFDDLRALKNFKILELNGAGAEPGHIYQPGFSLLKAYKVLFWHFAKLSEISATNRRKGVAHWGFKRGMKKLKAIKEYDRLIDKNT
ncbi:MAG: ATP-grasp domain-containing protein [Cyclobacteriaceae bacterium]